MNKAGWADKNIPEQKQMNKTGENDNGKAF